MRTLLFVGIVSLASVSWAEDERTPACSLLLTTDISRIVGMPLEISERNGNEGASNCRWSVKGVDGKHIRFTRITTESQRITGTPLQYFEQIMSYYAERIGQDTVKKIDGPWLAAFTIDPSENPTNAHSVSFLRSDGKLTVTVETFGFPRERNIELAKAVASVRN